MPKKSRPQSQSLRQRGGTGLDSVQLWGQDQVPPTSYKIQVGYLEIPKTIKFDEKWMDTPYRFRSFHDANDEARRIFGGYQVRVVGSNDQPYWDAPSYLHQNRNQLAPSGNQSWYDIVGVKEHHEDPLAAYSPMGQPPRLDPQKEYVLTQLSKLQTPMRPASQRTQQGTQRTQQVQRPQRAQGAAELSTANGPT